MFRFTCLLITGDYQLSVGCGWFSAGVQSHRDPSGGDIQISLSTSHSESNPLQCPYSVSEYNRMYFIFDALFLGFENFHDRS